jgi:probable rRNA maturation factor
VPPTAVASTGTTPGLRSTTLRTLVRRTLALLGRSRATVSVVLTDDARIRELNRDFREVDEPTDVLSFPLADPGELADPAAVVFLGEIYVSLERARAQATAARRPFPLEVAHLTVHGVLHLVGYDHATAPERRRMATLEASLLRRLRSEIAALGSRRS